MHPVYEMTYFAFKRKRRIRHVVLDIKAKKCLINVYKKKRQYFTYFAYTYVYSRSPVFCSNIHTQRMKKVHSKHIQEIHFLKLHSCVCVSFYSQ